MRVEQQAPYRSHGRHGQHSYGVEVNLTFFQHVEYQVYPGVRNIHSFLASLCLSLILTFPKVKWTIFTLNHLIFMLVFSMIMLL